MGKKKILVVDDEAELLDMLKILSLSIYWKGSRGP